MAPFFPRRSGASQQTFDSRHAEFRRVARGAVGLRWRTPLLLAAILLVLPACGKRKSRGVDSEPVRVQPDSLREIPAAPHFRLLSAEYGPTSATLRLAWEGPPLRPGRNPMLAVTLPGQRPMEARLVAATLNDKPLQVNEPTTWTQPSSGSQGLNADSASLEFMGYLREWPIHRLEMRNDPFAPARRSRERATGDNPGDGEAGDESNADPAIKMEFTIHATWPAAVNARPPAERKDAESRGRAALRAMARRFVVNPDALDRFAVATPPLNAGLRDDDGDPRALAPGERPWGRITVAKTGLYRLDPEALIKAGFPSARLAPNSIRIFSRGEAVPLLLAPDPANAAVPAGWPAGLYFHAEANDSPYDARRTYWVTIGAELPPCRLTADATPTTATATSASADEPLTQIFRTAVVDHDRELHTRHGSFLAIEEMRWVDAEFVHGKPLEVGLEFPGMLKDDASGSASLAGRLELLIDRPNNPLTETRLDVAANGHSLATLAFTGEYDTRKDFLLPAALIQDGRVTLTLRLHDPLTAVVDPTTTHAAGASGFGSGIFFDRAEVRFKARPMLHGGSLQLDADSFITSSPTRRDRPADAGDDDAPPGERRVVFPLDALTSLPTPLVALVIDPMAGRPHLLAPRGSRLTLAAPEGGERYVIAAPGAIESVELVEPVRFDDITSSSGPCDLLIIHHREFEQAARRLAAHRESQGWRARVVDVQSVFDHFSDGELSPEAIKRYLAYTQRHWGHDAPAFVILFGDANSDYRDVAAKGVRNWVPTYTYASGPEQWASDYWFTTFAGEDDLGDVILGRIPAAKVGDAMTIVEKVIAYDAAPRMGPWRARLAYVSDDGEFPEVVDQLRREATPAALAGRRVFLNELPLEDNWYLPQSFVESKRMKVSRAATDEILHAFRDGSAFLEYYGHGSPNIWSDERIWFGGDSLNSDNLHLADAGTMSFVANMTCNSGAIDYPLPPWNICITEDMLRVPGGGAIACYVPSGPGVTSVHQRMSESLRRGLFEDRERGIGMLTMLAKLRYTLERNPLDMTYMYLLLGDPLTELQLTRELREFDVSPPAAQPGSRIQLDLKGLDPATGQWIASLVDDKERLLWQNPPAEYADGRITAEVAVPSTATLGAAILRVYAWQPAGAKDLSASARLNILRPCLELNSVSVTTGTRGSVVRNEVLNPTPFRARGQLEWVLHDGITSRALGNRSIELAGGIAQQIESEPLREIAGAQPLVVESRLTLDQDPADASIARVQSRRTLLALPPDFVGIISALSALDWNPRGQSGQLRIMVATPEGSDDLVVGLRGPNGDGYSTQPLTAGEGSRARRAETLLSVDRVTFDRVAGGSVWLGRMAQSQLQADASMPATPATHGARAVADLHELPLALIPERRARPQIVPESVRIRPANPTEGETIFVDFEIENAGELPMEGTMAALFDRPPAQGGKQLESQGEAMAKAARIAPGRRMPLTLRWDPLRNAGPQTIYAALTQGFGEAQPAGEGQLVPLKINVRTKAKLAVTRTWAEASPQELSINRINLKAEIENLGETDARRVMVSFYRSKLIAPENKLGELEIERVPAREKLTANFTWKFDPARDMARGTQLPEPTVQLWLKGSSQRVTSGRP